MEVVRWFTIAAAIYAVVGTLVGCGLRRNWRGVLNFDISDSLWRLAADTNAVIFAFGGCV